MWLRATVAAIAIATLGCQGGPAYVSEPPPGTVAAVDPELEALRTLGETLQGVVTRVLPGGAVLDAINIKAPGAAIIDPATGRQVTTPEGDPLFTPTNTGLLGGALALAGVFLRGRRREKELEGKTEHERSKRKGLEDRVAQIEREAELAAARNGGGVQGRTTPRMS